jgi:hypothetical protein
MSLLYLAGKDFNLLRRAASVTVTIGGADALYPVANLYDDVPSVPFRFSSITANSAFKCDLNAILNSPMTAWTAGSPDNWIETDVGTGTVTQLSPGRGGAGSAARLNGGASGTATISQDLSNKFAAGDQVWVELYTSHGAGLTLKAQIYNLHTNKYLTSSNTWQTAATDYLVHSSDTSGAYVSIPFGFTLEPFGGTQPERPTLSLIIYTTSNGNVDVDDVVMYPGVNYASIHGHNLDAVTSQIQTSTDDFVAQSTTQGTFTVIRPAYYKYLGSMVFSRWWRFEFPGTNRAIPFIGEAVLGQAKVALRKQNYGMEVQSLFPQVRNQTPAGRQFRYPMTTDEQRAVTIGFKHFLSTQIAELRDEWHRRSGGGRYPMILVPSDTENIVIHGRADETFTYHWLNRFHWEDEITVTESPFPRPGF